MGTLTAEEADKGSPHAEGEVAQTGTPAVEGM